MKKTADIIRPNWPRRQKFGKTDLQDLRDWGANAPSWAKEIQAAYEHALRGHRTPLEIETEGWQVAHNFAKTLQKNSEAGNPTPA
jgi:hypothetical protein